MFVRVYSIGYSKHMRLIISLLLIAFAVCINAETVYKTVDENGNVIFTDRPSEDAEQIKLKELQTIKNPNPAKYSHRPRLVEDKGSLYKTLLITNPADGSGLRSNNGNLTISISLEPPLRSGHQIIITMDGQEISKGSSLNVPLQNVDRGAHGIGVSVVDSSGKKLTSTSSSFSLLRQ